MVNPDLGPQGESRRKFIRDSSAAFIGLNFFGPNLLTSPISAASSASQIQERAEIYRANFAEWSLNVDNPDLHQRYYDSETDEFHIVTSGFAVEARSLPRLWLYDFDLEITARKVDGSNFPWYGVTIYADEGTSEETRHRFMVSGQGTFSYEVATIDAKQRRQTDLEIIQPSRISPFVRRGDSRNVLYLIRRGGAVSFLSNEGVLLATETSLEGDKLVRIGIMAVTPRDREGANYIDVAFSKLAIYTTDNYPPIVPIPERDIRSA